VVARAAEPGEDGDGERDLVRSAGRLLNTRTLTRERPCYLTCK
jgi:hypothetical protein